MAFYVYRFLDKDGNVLYVGQTSQTLVQRFKQHKHLPQECYNSIAEIEYFEVPSNADMALYEMYYINKYKPPYNTAIKYEGKVDVALPEKEWLNFRELCESENQEYEEESFRSYKNRVIDIFLSKEKELKSERKKLKRSLNDLEELPYLIKEIIKSTKSIQIPIDVDKINEIAEQFERCIEERCINFKSLNEEEFNIHIRQLKMLFDLGVFNGKDDSGVTTYRVFTEMHYDYETLDSYISVNSNFLSYMGVLSGEILKNRKDIAKKLLKTNKDLESIRKQIGGIYKRNDEEEYYLNKILNS